MKTAVKYGTDRLLDRTEQAIMRQMRRLKKQERIIQRKQARAIKQLERSTQEMFEADIEAEVFWEPQQ
jgi:3-hydroxyacyl-CoA dehydrogenase